jgi:hypothetical protein
LRDEKRPVPGGPGSVDGFLEGLGVIGLAVSDGTEILHAQQE